MLQRQFFYTKADLIAFYNANKSLFKREPEFKSDGKWSEPISNAEIPGMTEWREAYMVDVHFDDVLDKNTDEWTRHPYYYYDPSRRSRVIYDIRTNTAYGVSGWQAKTHSLYLFERAFSRDYCKTKYFEYEKPAPNNIGVANAKKLQAWFDYLNDYAAAEDAYIKNAETKKAEYLKKVEDAGLRITYRGENAIVIRNENFELEVQFGSDGTIYQKMKYIGHSSLENFIALSK